MFLGRVIGQVVATKKEANLESRRLLVVRKLDERLKETAKEFVCVDSVAAKTGDLVLTCASSSARLAAAAHGTCADNAIVAIVETISASHKNMDLDNGRS
jgi:microcompartment protein CcmK/EutM